MVLEHVHHGVVPRWLVADLACTVNTPGSAWGIYASVTNVRILWPGCIGHLLYRGDGTVQQVLAIPEARQQRWRHGVNCAVRPSVGLPLVPGVHIESRRDAVRIATGGLVKRTDSTVCFAMWHSHPTSACRCKPRWGSKSSTNPSTSLRAGCPWRMWCL